MEFDDFLSKLDGVRQMPSGHEALCPAHEDHDPSLSVNPGREGGIVVFCHRGCTTAEVVAAMGLSMADLAGRPHIADEYVYTDDTGRPLWVVERWANPKDFRCRPGLPPAAQRVLYRADALAWARQRGAAVYVVEGEKDANRLAGLGLVSTTSVGGAGKWLAHYADQLAGTHVMVVADNDEPGRAHARTVARGCAEVAASVAMVVPRYGKDVSDLLDLGWTLDALDPLPEEDELGVVLAVNVRTRPVEWAWPGYVPFGAATILEGDPGGGKSIMSVDFAARWSSGAPMPDGAGHGGPYGVVMVSAEDDMETTIVPRLRAAGADLNLVGLVTHGVGSADRPFTLSTDIRALARYVIEHHVKIITLDPLMAFLADDVDSHSDHAVRRALYPLYRLAQDTGAAVVVIRHLNKGSGKAIYRGGGSIAFVGAARAAYTIGRDAEDPDKKIMACVKMNVAAEPSSLSFSVRNTDKGPFLEWHGPVDVDAQSVLDGRHNSEDRAIVDFLNTVVENGEPMTWREVAEVGRDLGYTEKMLRSRRDRSRLMQIVGHEGRRSTRWGYLEHTMAHLPTALPSAPESPTFPSPLTTPGGHAGPPAQTDPLKGDGKEGFLGEDGRALGTRESALQDPGDIDLDEIEEQRTTELEAQPLVCAICGSTDATRYAAPHWTIRCQPHNPRTMAG